MAEAMVSTLAGQAAGEAAALCAWVADAMCERSGWERQSTATGFATYKQEPAGAESVGLALLVLSQAELDQIVASANGRLVVKGLESEGVTLEDPMETAIRLVLEFLCKPSTKKNYDDQVMAALHLLKAEQDVSVLYQAYKGSFGFPGRDFLLAAVKLPRVEKGGALENLGGTPETAVSADTAPVRTAAVPTWSVLPADVGAWPALSEGLPDSQVYVSGLPTTGDTTVAAVLEREAGRGLVRADLLHGGYVVTTATHPSLPGALTVAFAMQSDVHAGIVPKWIITKIKVGQLKSFQVLKKHLLDFYK